MKTYIIIFITFFFVGCDRFSEYEISKSDGGRIYRLNKHNGEVSLIDGFNIIVLREPTEQALKIKSWPTITLPSVDSVKLNLKTCWREGKMYYILNVAPYTYRLKTAKESYLSSSKFTLEMTDANGFSLLQVPILLSSMTRIVDEKGEPMYITANDNTLCTSETYLTLANWSCIWNF
ncbi:MAG: hypothetical protein PHP42_10895 [Bacteroidota bacterium]|nr:hypothetical protein [Bacteroidota bacterium]